MKLEDAAGFGAYLEKNMKLIRIQILFFFLSNHHPVLIGSENLSRAGPSSCLVRKGKKDLFLGRENEGESDAVGFFFYSGKRFSGKSFVARSSKQERENILD